MTHYNKSFSQFDCKFSVAFDAISAHIRKGRVFSVSAIPTSINGGPIWTLKYYISDKNNIAFYLEFQSPSSDFKFSLFIEPTNFQSLTSTHFTSDQHKLTDRTVDIEHWVKIDDTADNAYTLLESTNFVFQQSFSVRVSAVSKKWKTMKKDFVGLQRLPSKSVGDVTLVCGSERMCVHSTVLNARAHTLYRIWRDFYKTYPNKKCKIVLPFNFSPDVLKPYVCYLYAKRDSELDLTQLTVPEFAGSDYFHPHKLIRQCLRMLCAIVCEQNVYDVMCFASRWNLRDVLGAVSRCYGNIDYSSEAQARRKRNPPVINKGLELATALYCEIYEYACYLR